PRAGPGPGRAVVARVVPGRPAARRPSRRGRGQPPGRRRRPDPPRRRARGPADHGRGRPGQPPRPLAADLRAHPRGPQGLPHGRPAANGCAAPPPGFVDPASCVAPPGFGGRRLFAFEEPYVDQQGSGHYDAGDPFVDCNQDGRWDGNFLGGGSNAPRFYDHVADPVTARAIVVSNGTRTIAVEVLDHEGASNVLYQAIRQRLVDVLPNGAGLDPVDVFVS